MRITHRGWPGHFICSSKCQFRLNTLITHKDIKVVVSTVGRMVLEEKEEVEFMEIGINRHFETMVFHADDTEYHDADIQRQIFLLSNWQLPKAHQELEANKMHETVIAEIKQRILNGEFHKKEQGE